MSYYDQLNKLLSSVNIKVSKVQGKTFGDVLGTKLSAFYEEYFRDINKIMNSILKDAGYKTRVDAGTYYTYFRQLFTFLYEHSDTNADCLTVFIDAMMEVVGKQDDTTPFEILCALNYSEYYVYIDKQDFTNENKSYDKIMEALISNAELDYGTKELLQNPPSTMPRQNAESTDKIESELLSEEKRITEERRIAKEREADKARQAAERKYIEEKQKAAEERRIAKEREAEMARQAAERKRIVEEQKAAENARRAVEERIARKKILRQSIIICIIGLFIFVSFILYKNIFTPMFYIQANELLEDKQYAKAISKFRMANNYNDSKEKIHECYYSIAMNLLETDEFSKAIVNFDKASNFNDSNEKIRECHYLLAMNLLESGQLPKAYSEFELADNFKDSEEQAQNAYSKYMEGENTSNKLSTFFASGEDHSVFLKEDGTVVAQGAEKGKSYDQCDVASWKDIIAIAAGLFHTVGLKKDGTVVAVDSCSWGQSDVASWKDVVAIAAGGYLTVGLKKDGTVVAAGNLNALDVKYDVTSWKDIDAIAIGFDHIVGLKKDGTVICTGSNDRNQNDTASWKDIVAIAAGYGYTVGLKKDGTVVAVGSLLDNEDITSWKGIVAIASGNFSTIGLKIDGTVMKSGWKQYDVTSWKDIVAITAGDRYIVGLKKDGKVNAMGLDGLESKISSLGGIGIP